MKSRKIASLLLTGAMTAALLAVPAQAAEAPQLYTIQATQPVHPARQRRLAERQRHRQHPVPGPP